jgi:hypothetical protein
MDKSNGSVMALIYKLSKISNHEEIVIAQTEYDQLIHELWCSDSYLKNRYDSPNSIPRMHSLYGVKISIS